MIDFMYGVCLFIGAIMNSITLLIVFKVALPKKLPMDESNRINHIRLIWWAITKPHKFANTFYWMRQDEGENLND